MQIYKTPLREFKFLIEDFLNLKESQTLKKLDLETSDLMLIIEEAAKLCEETLLPLNPVSYTHLTLPTSDLV